jgi:hypothetical protein
MLRLTVLYTGLNSVQVQCASCRGVGGGGLNPPAIGANPLADCTSDPSGGGLKGQRREGRGGEDPLF